MASGIRWLLGVIMVGAAGIAFLFGLGPAVADVVYLKTNGDFVLTNPQKTALANWITGAWPAFKPAKLDKIYCSQGILTGAGKYACVGIDEDTITASDYADKVLEGRPPAIVSIDGSNVTVVSQKGPAQITGQSLTDLGTMLSSACSLPDISVLREFTCEKQSGAVVCRCIWLKTDTPENFVLEVQAGTALGAVGRVE